MVDMQNWSSHSRQSSSFRRLTRRWFFFVLLAVLVGIGLRHVWPSPPPVAAEQLIDSSLSSSNGVGQPAVNGGVPDRAVQPQEKVALPVLMYHYIRVVNRAQDKLGYNLSVTPDNFRAQMDYLARHGFVTVAPTDIPAAWAGNQPLSDQSILLTFDDGYADFYSVAFPVLQALQLKATLYVVTDFVDKPGYVTWEQIAEMDQSGLVTIGSHTRHHVDVTRSAENESEIVAAKIILEDRLGHPVTSFCYPAGRFNDGSQKTVAAAGYELAFTTKPGRVLAVDQRFALPRLRIEGTTTLERFISLVSATKNP